VKAYPHVTDRARLREAYIELLSRFPMQWFCTLTFRESVHPEQAFKLFRVWTNEINRQLYGRRWHKRGDGIYWVLAWEYQQRGVLHFHALLGDVSDLNTKVWRLERMDRWDELAGIARVEDIQGHVAVERYVSKYVVKGGLLDFSRSLSAFARQPSLSIPRSKAAARALLCSP
jgi:hypothetical protein